jgi:hypothetical protein
MILSPQPQATSEAASKEKESKQKDTKAKDKSTPSSESAKEHLHSSEYDPMKREPQFAQAALSCMWELVTYCLYIADLQTELSRHYHPSVVKFSNALLAGWVRILRNN